MTCFREGSTCAYKPSRLLSLPHLFPFYFAPSLATYSPPGVPCFLEKDNNTERVVIICWTPGQAGPLGEERHPGKQFLRGSVFRLSKMNYVPRDERGCESPTVAGMLGGDLNAFRALSSPQVCLLLWVSGPYGRAWHAQLLTEQVLALSLSKEQYLLVFSGLSPLLICFRTPSTHRVGFGVCLLYPTDDCLSSYILETKSRAWLPVHSLILPMIFSWVGRQHLPTNRLTFTAMGSFVSTSGWLARSF